MKKFILILVSIVLLTGLLFAQKTATKKATPPKQKPLITFVSLGAESCMPCKMMRPVIKEIGELYKDKLETVFYDIRTEREAANQYKIRVIPTQVFLDAEGKEFHRHEGFYAKEQIQKMLDEYLASLNKAKKK